MNRKHFLYSLFFLGCLYYPINTVAQVEIAGKLIGSNKQGVEACNVRLLHTDSTFVAGTVSDAFGRFVLKNIHEGQYILMTSHIEYVPCYRNLNIGQSDISLGYIVLANDTKSLEGIQVMADRIVQQKDGMLIYPRKSQLKFAGSGYDVLYNLMIPGVNVDRANSTVLRLGQEVALYMDGQKVGYREIQNINPGLIEKIEYVDMPSGRYIHDNAAINIVTRKSTTSTYLSVDGKQDFGYMQGSYNTTYQRSRNGLVMYAYGGCDVSNYDNAGSTVSENYGLESGDVYRNSEYIQNKSKGNSQYVQFNLRKNKENSSLAAKVSFVHKTAPDNKTQQCITYVNWNILDRQSREIVDENGYRPSFELYGSFKFPHNQSLVASMSGSYNKNKYIRCYDENDFSVLMHADEDMYNANANLNYQKSMKNGTFTLSLLDFYQLSKSDYAGTSAYKQKLHTNEAIFRAGYMRGFGRQWMLNVQAGMSLLNYEQENEETVSKLSPRVNMMLRYMLSQQHAFSFQVNAGNSFPTLNALNTVGQAVNAILVKRGNPTLKTSNMYNTALMYNLNTRNVNLQAMLIANLFTHMPIPYYYTEGDKVVQTYRDDVDHCQYLAVLSGSYSMLKNLQLKAELAMLHYQFKKGMDLRQTTYRAILDVNYSLKNWMFNLSARAKEKRLANTTVFEEDFVSYGGSIRWSVPSWLLEVGFSNPLTDSNYLKTYYESPAYSYDSRLYSKQNQRDIYLKVTYRFNKGKKQNVNNGMDKSINSAILKAE